MMDWTPFEASVPDEGLVVLVCSTCDEKFMAVWDGECWLHADSEMPFSGEVAGWLLLEDVPGVEESNQHGQAWKALQIENREMEVELEEWHLRETDYCADCFGKKYRNATYCSGCGDHWPDETLAKPAPGYWLCLNCSAQKINELEALR